MKVRRSDIAAIETSRPAGYAEALYRAARKADDEFLYFDLATYKALYEQFREENYEHQSATISEAAMRILGWIALLRSSEDTGVGDTIERLLASVGGRRIKKWIGEVGIDCGCPARQAWLNHVYPYR